MKKAAWVFLSLAVLAAASAATEVSAAEAASYTSNGAVDFIPNTDPDRKSVV